MPNLKANNLGLLHEPRLNPRDFFFGVSTAIEYKPVMPSMTWAQFLPIYEPQSNPNFDTQSCVTFAALNCMEIWTRFLTGVEQNFSDRFTAVISNTTQQGNFMSAVAEAVRTKGLLPESDYPFAPSIATWDQYHAKPLPPSLIEKAAEWLKSWEVGWEWVGTSDDIIARAIATSPLSVSVQVGSPTNDKGYYTNRDGSYGHLVTLYARDTDHYKIFDHYSNTYKKYDLSYKFGAIMRWALMAKNTMPTNPNPLGLKNDTLLQLVEGVGGFGLYLNGKIIVDKVDLVLASWMMRNSGDIIGKTRPVKLADWMAYPKINLKGEPVV